MSDPILIQQLAAAGGVTEDDVLPVGQGVNGLKKLTIAMLRTFLVPAIAKGDRGKSAYELALEDGFEGSLGDWLETLISDVAGPAPTIELGDVTTLAAGAPATIQIEEAGPGAYTISFGVPAGRNAYDWNPNFNADGALYIAAREAMTIAVGNPPIGTGAIAYAKSTAGAPGVFANTALPATLEAGAWLRVTATGVVGFLAADIFRSA